ncbi:MAG: hypothetical protein ACSLE6_20440 [Mycobacterium sp.]
MYIHNIPLAGLLLPNIQCTSALGYGIQDPPGGFESWDAALEEMGIPPERHNLDYD